MSGIELTHGPAQIGIQIACILYGITFIQSFEFLTQNNHGKRQWLSLYVGVLFLTDTLSTIFSLMWIFDCLIVNFSNPPALAFATWDLAADPALVGITGTMCQLFFAWRIKVLTGKPWLAGLVAVLAVASGLCAIGAGIAIPIVKELAHFDRFQVVGCLWLGLTALVDLLITVCMSSNLNQRKTGFKQTDSLINRIIGLTVANGLLTTVFAITELGLYVGLPLTGLHIGFSFILPKLYCNSVLSTLNSNRRGTASSDSDHISYNTSSQPVQRNLASIRVETEQHRMVDLDGSNSVEDGKMTGRDWEEGSKVPV